MAVMPVVPPAVNVISRRLPGGWRQAAWHRLGDALRRGPRWNAGLRKCRRIVARRRRVANAVSYLMDYGPDWPPPPRPATSSRTLLRRCLTTVVLYAVIWALGATLLELRLFELRELIGGTPVTTYTTVTGPPHRGHD
jgi:hypothetical protein